ncbi:MAG: NADH-quinone oxidoreductase subunit J [Candidatus Poriferisodalaceae bacterium]|jgi:NADH-quinone oxidoreductase subunit J
MIDTAVFVIAAIVCVSGALGVVFAKNAVHSALMLVMTLFGIAVQFVALEAHFLAAVQVIVYAGAIVVLFLFVIMLLGVDKDTDLEIGSLKPQVSGAIMFAVGGVGIVAWLIVTVNTATTGAPSVGGAIDGETENVRLLARSLFSDYVYAFELTSLLLVIAVIGAVVLARKPKKSDEVTQ